MRQRLSFDFQKGWPQTLSEIDIALDDGRQFSARHDSGIPAADIAEQGRRLTAKFDTLVAPVLGAPRARELRDAVGALDGLADIGALTGLAAR